MEQREDGKRVGRKPGSLFPVVAVPERSYLSGHLLPDASSVLRQWNR